MPPEIEIFLVVGLTTIERLYGANFGTNPIQGCLNVSDT